MTNQWKFGGTDLSTFGVITLFDDYLDLPEARGKNIVIPFRHGTRFVPKFYDERTLQMGITITAASADALEVVLGSLRALLAPRTEQTLSQTLTDASVRTVPASVNKALQINRPTPWTAKLVIEFDLSYPFFRLSTAITSNTTTINASPKAMSVVNPGTVAEYSPTITLTGPLTNPVITNTTNGTSLSYAGVISSGHTVIISTNANGEYTAVHSVTGSVIGSVTHAGSSALLVINVGTNALSITSSVTTTGTVGVSFNAPYV